MNCAVLMQCSLITSCNKQFYAKSELGIYEERKVGIANVL